MNEEEYLRASGWKEADSLDENYHAMWKHKRRPPVGFASTNYFTRAEAVEAQVAEDRTRFNFMRERSEWRCGVLVPLADKGDDCKGAER